MLVEVCVQNVEAALLASKAGADRLELCENLAAGGVSPSEALVHEVQNLIDIPIHVLVRPRDGGFLYNASEYETILQEIQAYKKLGVAGIVIGVLKEDQTIDLDRIREIRRLTEDLHLTFHRAFDLVPDPIQAIKDLEKIEVNTLLTSGQKDAAIEGLAFLQELKTLTANLTIMPGAGINPENIKVFKDAGFDAVHFSGTRKLGISPGIPGSDFGDQRSDKVELVFEPNWVRTMINCVK